MSQNGHDSKPGGNAPGVRLQRVMAEAGVASRRDCEAMIEQGLVEVNGKVVNRLPVFIDPTRDRITVDGQPLRLKPGLRGPGGGPGRNVVGDERLYIMLHKPDRVLCTTSDDTAESETRGGARTTVTDLVQHRSGARIYPVGRLDYHSTGLVLLTNDGELADRLTHARYGVTRTYRVTIKGEIRDDILDDLRRRVGRAGTGDSTDGGADDFGVRIARSPGAESSNTVLEVTLREGRNRQLQAILEQMGCMVRKLTRVGIGPLRLHGVAVGEWRNLTREEVADLRAAGGIITRRPRPATGSQRASAPSSSSRNSRPSRPGRSPGPRSTRDSRGRDGGRRAGPGKGGANRGGRGNHGGRGRR